MVVAKDRGKTRPFRFNVKGERSGRSLRIKSSVIDRHWLMDVMSTSTVPAIDYISLGITR